MISEIIVHYLREVFSVLLQDPATAPLAAHNHPSGNVYPSNEDREITVRLHQAGEIHPLTSSCFGQSVYNKILYAPV